MQVVNTIEEPFNEVSCDAAPAVELFLQFKRQLGHGIARLTAVLCAYCVSYDVEQ